MKKVRITVIRTAKYEDLIKKYEKHIDNPCDMKEGQIFIVNDNIMPEGFCLSAWETLFPFIKALANGETKIYGDWMKDETSALISCNDGFRPVSFLLEVVE